MLKSLALSKGDVLDVASSASGGYSFQNHCDNSTSINLIFSRTWDYVVLQEQSQKPAFPPSQVEAETYPYAKKLCDTIRKNSMCTNVLFFMTWGYKNGDSRNCPYYPPICTYEGMQTRLKESYLEMANNNNAAVAPVGMCFKKIRETNPEIELYSSDESHPSVHGTYLAACAFYATIFNKTPQGATFVPQQITQQQAEILQSTAWQVVNEDINTWNIDTTTMRVDFEYFNRNFNCVFNNNSENIDSCLWNFGDNQTSWQYPNVPINLVHTYCQYGDYNVCITAYRKCETKEVCKIVSIQNANQILSIENNSIITVSPNPIDKNSNKLKINNYKNNNYQIFSANGKLLKQGFINNDEIDISELEYGMYFIKNSNNYIKFIIK